MTRDEFIKKFPVGSKVRLKDWVKEVFREVLFHGNECFFYKSNCGTEYSSSYDNYWLPYEEQKKGFKLWDVVRWTEFAIHTRGDAIVIEHDIMKGVTKAFFPDEMRVETYHHPLNSGETVPLEKVEGKVAMAPASWDYENIRKNISRHCSEPMTKELADSYSNSKSPDFRWPHSIASLTIEVVK